MDAKCWQYPCDILDHIPKSLGLHVFACPQNVDVPNLHSFESEDDPIKLKILAAPGHDLRVGHSLSQFELDKRLRTHDALKFFASHDVKLLVGTWMISEPFH